MLHPKDGPYGFFPMELGQVLDNKYTIVRKLGYGANATVWLAQEQTSDSDYRYVVIKVLSTNATNCEHFHVSHDLEVARRLIELSEEAKSDPGCNHCAIPWSIFRTRSQWGEHACIVAPPLSVSLEQVRLARPGDRLELAAVKRATKQILLGLGFLHNKLNVVHADVKLANVLIKMYGTTADIDGFLRSYPAETYPLPSGPGVPSDLVATVQSMPLLDFGPRPFVENFEVCITDYGITVRADSITAGTPVDTPDALRAPEQLLGHPWSYPVDVWSLGCEVIEMLTGSSMINFPPDCRYSKEEHLARIYELLGPFPVPFLQRCTDSDAKQYFDTNGNHVRAPPPAEDALEKQLHAALAGEITPREIDSACAFLRRCLTIDPQTRPTVSELLADAWLAS